ncbi:hypothetical protein JCM10212_001291 [Sporobolomyces blumeae]
MPSLTRPSPTSHPFQRWIDLAPNRAMSPHLSDDSSLLHLDPWISRFRRLETLGEPLEDRSPFSNDGHRVIKEHYGSTGCVNALDWEQGRQERLASAGDDTKICIWTPGLDRLDNPNEPSSDSPFLGYGLSDVIDTGHRANIFGVKWAPENENRLFSCAGDSTVRVYDLSLATNSSLSTSTVYPPPPASTSSSSPSANWIHRPWSHHESASACTTVLRCHSDRVKRISTESSPDVFLTCSEDGTVRQHDLRQPHACRRTTRPNRPSTGSETGQGRVWDDSSATTTCPAPLADYSASVSAGGRYGRGIALYSLTVSKLRPHLFVVAGTSPFAYLHDRRMARRPMLREWGVAPRPERVTECVRRYGVPRRDGLGGFIDAHVVATKISPDDARDLIVSYSEAGIYRFDLLGDTYSEAVLGKEEVGGKQEEGDERGTTRVDETQGPGHETRQQRFEKGQEKREDEIGDPSRREDRRERDALVGQCDEDDADEEMELVPSVVDEGAGARQATRTAMVETEDDEDEEDDESDDVGDDEEEDRDDSDFGPKSDMDEDDVADALASDPSSSSSNAARRTLASVEYPHSDAPVVAPTLEYTGHANSQTVKDVNFAFKGSAVVSGSDDGNFFVWDKDTAECRAIFHGDSSVVNVLAPHPRLPLLAVSGIDPTVGIYGPSMDLERVRRENKVGEFETIKRRNASRLGGGGASSLRGAMINPALLSFLATRTGLAFGEEEDGDGHGEGGGGRGGAGVRIFFEDPEAPGERRAAECLVM